ncbi:hypothetical protein EMIHUDRAFT_214989 [Emiliania huxleyi CCMP1516]|uniref:rRNA-processing protein efg1 n=2 Tax=Emiliania huxleyi TaxID=2903 RepID=A0A0D3IIR2_EMIH1|nr:hypothetical protein EMIHUDRAFT_214989 [Emiliania huxleyi CCMP1516]EOD11147.1 hypothetical protein EMIHUDRAFT_214989 [Emiliania huxleyi CCMP1516]|eukprot:XP_005763576.1 hypothetical protein EMIHUDRAFT_214989 [Emiliania huxleyi CCMP1516]
MKRVRNRTFKQQTKQPPEPKYQRMADIEDLDALKKKKSLLYFKLKEILKLEKEKQARGHAASPPSAAAAAGGVVDSAAEGVTDEQQLGLCLTPLRLRRLSPGLF